MEETNGDSTQSNSASNLKFTAVRLDLRRLTSSGRHGPRSQVLVISDQTSGLEVKRMVAEKNGFEDHLVSQMDLVATVASGHAKMSECLVSDGSCLLDVHRVTSSTGHSVSFSLKWKKELKASKTNYMSPSYLHNFNTAPVQDLSSESTSEKSNRKSDERISFTNGSNFPGYKRTERSGPPPTTSTVDLKPLTDHHPVRRLRVVDASSSSSNSSWHPNRSTNNECIIHYEPQNLSSETDVRNSNFHTVVAVQELRSSVSSTPVSEDRSRTGRRTSYKELETGSVDSPGVRSTANGSNDSQHNNNSFNRLPTIGSLSRGDRNSLDDVIGQPKSTCFQAFCPVVPAGKVASGDADRDGDQREARFSSLPNMDQMTEAQRCQGGTQTSVRPAASSSLPCISTTVGGWVGAGRRCLPQLCIPEEIVEEKRNLLSKRLEKKLQSADRKKKRRRKRTAGSHLNTARESLISNGRLGTNEGNDASDNDDCASVTSWEVAEILASADPMAPQDSDYEDSPPPSTDDDNVTSAFKNSCRVMSSPSDADTLDGSSSSTESPDHKSELLFAKDFSPIQCHARSDQHARSKLDFRSHRSSENTVVISAKPIAISNVSHSSQTLTTLHNPVRIIRHPPKASYANVLTLFKLLRGGGYRVRTSVLFRSRSSEVRRVDRLPFEIFNDVIHLNGAQKKGAAMERFTVPVIGDCSAETSADWECLEGSIEAGDVVLEVNGDLVLNRSSSEVIATCLRSSDNLQFLLARQRRTQK